MVGGAVGVRLVEGSLIVVIIVEGNGLIGVDVPDGDIGNPGEQLR